jgi:hypothetical protein
MITENLGPASPGVDFVRCVHRGGDGYVVFVGQGGGRWSEYSVRLDRLQAGFDELSDDLNCDAYVSINTTFRAAGRLPNRVAVERGHRPTAAVKYLNACFVDLDFYKEGVDEATALERISDLESTSAIPPISLLVDSGRGIWALWLLYDPDNESRPPKGDPVHYWRSYNEWVHVQEEIGRKFRDLGADPCACDAARVMRLPASINSKCGRQVQLLRVSNCAYSLPEIASLLGIRMPQVSEKEAKHPSRPPVSVSRSKTGYRRLNELRLRQFQRLQQLRGGFREGCRNYAALLLAIFLRGTGASEQAIAEAVRQMGRQCRPSLPPFETERQLKSALGRKWRITDARIAEWLGITDEEASHLETWRAAGDDRPRSTQGTRKSERQAALRRVIESDQVHGLCAIAEVLRAAGFAASPETVRRDCLEIGVGRKRLSRRQR